MPSRLSGNPGTGAPPGSSGLRNSAALAPRLLGEHGADVAQPVVIARNSHPVEPGALAHFAEETDAAGHQRVVDVRIHFLAVDRSHEAVAVDIDRELHGPVVVHHDIQRRLRALYGFAVATTL